MLPRFSLRKAAISAAILFCAEAILYSDIPSLGFSIGFILAYLLIKSFENSTHLDVHEGTVQSINGDLVTIGRLSEKDYAAETVTLPMSKSNLSKLKVSQVIYFRIIKSSIPGIPNVILQDSKK